MRKANKLLALFLAVLMVVTSMVTMTVTTVSADTAAPVAEETHPTTWWDANAATDFAGGTGTEADPYQISTPEQLAYFAKYLERGELDGATDKVYFELTQTIDMSAHQWKPIGYTANDTAYKTHTLNNGVLNGNGNTVTGIKLTASVAMAGGYTYANGCAFFTKISGASVVQNLNLEVRIVDPTHSADNAAKNNAVAGLAATVYDSTQITNVTVTVDMDITAGSGTTYYGGLVGYTNAGSGHLRNINVTGDMNIQTVQSETTKAFIGGIMGYYKLSFMSGIYNYAKITYVAGRGNDSGIGGIAADCAQGPVGNIVENHGELVLSPFAGGKTYMGGCFGSCIVIRDNMTNLKNHGNITVTNSASWSYVGGLIGRTYNQGTNLVGAENHGNITVNRTGTTNPTYVGGIIAYTNRGSANDTELSNVTDCTNAGNITFNYSAGMTPNENPYIGGIVGVADYVIVTGCINTGALTVNNVYGDMSLGGIVGNLPNYTQGSDKTAVINCINRGHIRMTDAVEASADNSRQRYVGGIMGNLGASSVTGSVNEGSIIISNAKGPYNIGGITGNVSNSGTTTLTDNSNYGDIVSHDQDGDHRFVGGIAGLALSGSITFTNCHNYGNLTRDGVRNSAYLGGIVTAAQNAVITDCSNSGAITMTVVSAGYSTTGTNYVAGLAADMRVSGKVTDSHSYGAVTCSGGTSAWHAGGLTGRVAGVTIDGCTNTADVQVINGVAGNYYVGGINGSVASGSTFRNSENSGHMTVQGMNRGGNAYVGGVSGQFIGVSVMTDISNRGDIYASGTANAYLGGIAGGVNVGGNQDTAAEMTDLFNQGTVNSGDDVSITRAHGGIIGRLSNDNGRITDPIPMHDIVNAVNVGTVRTGSFSGGIIGYTASSRKKVNSSDSKETACRYAVNLRGCFAMNTNGGYGLVGSVRNAVTNIENCFTDATAYLTYHNQDTDYLSGTTLTINGTALEGQSIAHNPTGVTHIENVVTLEMARVRLDSMGTDDSGIRFDSYIDKATYDALTALESAGLTFELGTLIAPTQNLQIASVANSYKKTEALDAIKVGTNNTYVAVPYGDTFFAGENADHLYFAGALNHMKKANYNVKFTAIAYLKITLNGFTVTLYADYDEFNENRERSIAQISYSAYRDRANEETTEYSFAVADGYDKALGAYSRYTNVQLAKLSAFCASYQTIATLSLDVCDLNGDGEINALDMVTNMNTGETYTNLQNLLCDHRENPLGIDIANPYLSWNLNSNVQGQRQSAYRIVVASSEEKFAAGNYDMWDYTATSSDMGVFYAGVELAPRTQYYWTVFAFDKDGNVISPAGEFGVFETALFGDFGSDNQWITEGIYQREADTGKFWANITVKSLALGIKFGQSTSGNTFFMWQFNMRNSTPTLVPHVCIANGTASGSESWSVLPAVDISAALGGKTSQEMLGQSFNVSIVVEDTSIKTYVNGTLVHTYTDTAKLALLTRMGTVEARTAGNESGTINQWSVYELNSSTPLYEMKENLPYAAKLFRREFEVADGKEIAKARLYVTSSGTHMMYLNGERCSDDYLAPGKFEYYQTVYYQTYDVTALLLSGANTLACELGVGWLNGGPIGSSYPDPLALKAKLVVTYADGTEETIDTDGSWLVRSDGPTTLNRFYDGQHIDARKEIADWNVNGADTAKWRPCIASAANGKISNNFVAENTNPVRAIRIENPVTVTSPASNVFVYRFNTNLVGTLRITASAPAGTKITLRYSEMLTAGGYANVGPYTINGRDQNGEDSYIFAGTGAETFEFSMVYHGFQYVEITGLSSAISFDGIEALVLSTDNTRTGSFISSNELINRYFDNTIRSQEGNFIGAITDCPTREKNNWTGDAQGFAYAANYNYNAYNIYRAFQEMTEQAQNGTSGQVPELVPAIGKPSAALSSFKTPSGWSDTVILIPWQLYHQYGDASFLTESYDAMKLWADYLIGTCKDNGYIRTEGWYGDNLAYDSTMFIQDTASEKDTNARQEIGTAYSAYSIGLLAEMAAILGNTADAEYYAAESEKFAAAWRANFLEADGFTCKTTTQTSYAMGIYYDLYETPELRQKAADKLAELIINGYEVSGKTVAPYCQTVGFIGMPILYHALSQNGHAEVAFRLLEQTQYPSLLYAVTQGATTTWETYAYQRSLNHFFTGCSVSWLYSDILGITHEFDESNAGYRRFVLAPTYGGTMTHAQGSYDSVSGRIESAWTLAQDGTFTFTCTIPANTTATIKLPITAETAAITVGGVNAANVEGIDYVKTADGRAWYEVVSGTYTFTVTPATV